MKRYVIEREIPGVGELCGEPLRGAAAKSNGVLEELGTGIHWEHSYVTANRLFCVYRAESEELVREHAKRSGFPATTISEVKRVIDPLTANQ